MKISIATVFALLASGSIAQLPYQSPPFALQVISRDATWNGQYLAACHEGAAIESLCIYGVVPVAFNFNYSTPTPDPTTQGWLTYELRGGNFNLSQPMKLSYDAATNIAVPLFYPDMNGQSIGFDINNFMFIQGMDDTIQPRNISVFKPYKRWYVCQTYVGYLLNTLAWGLGAAAPQNPTCSKVEVKRIYL